MKTLILSNDPYEALHQIRSLNSTWRSTLSAAKDQARVPAGFKSIETTPTHILYRDIEGKEMRFEVKWSVDGQSCEISKPSLLSRVKSLFTRNQSATAATLDVTSSDEPATSMRSGGEPSAGNAREIALREQIESVRREKEALLAKHQAHAERLRTADARAFAEEIIAAGHALPYERATIETGYIHCATNDAALAAFKSAYEKRPAHNLTQELLIPETSRQKSEEEKLIKSTYEQSAQFAQERNREELLKLTPLGCAVLENQQ